MWKYDCHRKTYILLSSCPAFGGGEKMIIFGFAYDGWKEPSQTEHFWSSVIKHYEEYQYSMDRERHAPYEFICPRMLKTDLGGRWVDTNYCESHCAGQGCSEKSTCKNYQRFKTFQQSHSSLASGECTKLNPFDKTPGQNRNQILPEATARDTDEVI
jgi:hypothetical protein